MPQINLGSLFAGNQQRPQIQQQNPMMSYQDALKQAQAALDPQYQKMLKTTLGNIDRNSMARGFYGQLPTDVFKRSTAGDLSMQHQANLAQYANQVQQQNFQNQMALNQFDWQKQQYEDQKSNQLWSTVGTAAGYLLGGPVGGAFGNWLGGLF